MTISKPPVGRSGWNTTFDEVIDAVNDLVAGETGDRAYAAAQDAAHVAASDPHGDRAYASAQDAAHVAATDPHGDRAYTDAQITARAPMNPITAALIFGG